MRGAIPLAEGRRMVKHSFLDLEPLAYFDEVLARFSEGRTGWVTVC
jgi:hypothetical protein